MTTKFRAAVIACALALMAAGGATAQAHHKHADRTGTSSKAKVTGGDTTLTLNDAAKTGLAGQGITIAPKDPATSPSAGTFTFPIAGGKLDTTTLFGFAANKGGVVLTKGDHTVKVRHLVVVNGKNGASVWALVGRVHKFSARGHHKFAKASHNGGGRRGAKHHFRWRWHVARVLTLSNVAHSTQDGKQVITADAALTKRAAKFLNRKLDTTLFGEGQGIGTIKVTAATG